MDLSPIIFVVLVLAWAVYLIPKALSHHDEVAGDRLEQGHTDKVRILTRARRVTASVTGGSSAAPGSEAPGDQVVVETVETAVEVTEIDRETTAPARRTAALPTRASARRAARNRRRVLSVLLATLVVVGGLAVGGVVSVWLVAVPAVLVVAFLAVARASVRRMQQARRTGGSDRPAGRPVTEGPVAPAESVTAAPAAPAAPAAVDDTEAALEELTHDQPAERREEIETALSDAGSLWDPLPLTLPTYVNKAHARRTVRTIELTGITSSGHDAADSAVAREAAQQAAEDAEARTMPSSKVVGG